VLRHEDFDTSQSDFAGDSQSDQSLAAFVDQVAARLGRDCLQAFELHESHVPERASIFVPAVATMANHPKTFEGSHAGFSRAERPLRLFRMPEPVETFAAEVPEGPPLRFRWRRTMHEVLRAEGPERLAAEWWIEGEDASPRDYFRLEVQTGHRFWMFREGLYGHGAVPRWLMHGVFA
jgi:protein ImuB